MRVERRSELVSKREEVREGEKAAHIIVLYTQHRGDHVDHPTHSLNKQLLVQVMNEQPVSSSYQSTDC